MAQRKFEIGDRVTGTSKQASVWTRKGQIVEFAPSSKYWVQFDDGKRELVPSSSLELWAENPYSAQMRAQGSGGAKH